MTTLESALAVFAPHRFSNNYRFTAKPPHSIKFHGPTSLFSLSQNLLFSSKSTSKTRKLCFELCSALQEVAATPTTEEEPEQTQPTNNAKTKLYVFNIPWSLSSSDIKELFGQCGTVTDVEIIKNKNGKSRGFAFVTMASGEEAQAAVDKFDSHEISGRIIRVALARRFKKPPPPRPPGPPPGETRHVIYVSNLAWKARSTHLRELFTENFKTPATARVVFDSPSGRSAGYGFVSFLTKEEAEAAISAMDGKELMGRPLRLKFSEKKVKEAGSENNDEDQVDDAQLEES
ncbi:30 kDa ribonucleoprotein, chloroplastic [Gastrolobium bilobum]|uniref:30 kDa ribonucleoprotein, chloroplastic n=1 Tax=Gastrolobium bilobum TaxID=150636 RepID=UPI002AB0EAAF|nr:30 kDa ribonucleoprotein, chloroplastic [Gastrolobium bilobum]